MLFDPDQQGPGEPNTSAAATSDTVAGIAVTTADGLVVGAADPTAAACPGQRQPFEWKGESVVLRCIDLVGVPDAGMDAHRYVSVFAETSADKKVVYMVAPARDYGA